jgi:hypothetical protein
MPGDFMNEKAFSERLYAFMEGKNFNRIQLSRQLMSILPGRGTPISKIPVFDHKELVGTLVFLHIAFLIH